MKVPALPAISCNCKRRLPSAQLAAFRVPLARHMHPAFAQQFNAAVVRTITCALLAVAACTAAGSTAAKLIVMHGYAELTSATLWIQSDRAGAVTVAWRVDGDTNERIVELSATEANDNIVVPSRSA